MAPPVADGAVFGDSGAAGFAFLKRNGVWLALGDPRGETSDRISAIWRFRDLCEAARVDPAVWSVGPDLQRVYADIGLTVFPTVDDPAASPTLIACRAEHDIDNLRLLLPERQDLR